MFTNRQRLAGVVIAAAALSVSACSNDDTVEDTASETVASESATDNEATMAESEGPAGPGCAAYAEAHTDGPASLEAISGQNVVEALPNIPELSTLTAALTGELNGEVNLVSTIQDGEWTIFAPTDDAFAKVDDATIEALKTDADLLSTVLTYHVVDGQAGLDAIAGEHTTVAGEMVTVTIDGDEMKVNDSNITCGGISTTNATVYLIDSVLMPPM
ncbi:fasciclin domain-containing protein [Corynebacterium sp. TAE3-ERU12]|uniref:fasciclin domain-containing protein n=1 Tax=Corynebacterium sp. TAE3-ERU12 TaxID=2849491 RepID=UPI001C47E2CB|nr:fasciclin domain-containing protein [Corynebacterium sp. TAE3-ERU12]MBV7295789.1 fasciclin domain-containing protein [Corynebacterium sp. TAE3-ERU12]